MLTLDPAHSKAVDLTHKLETVPTSLSVTESLIPPKLVLAVPMTGLGGVTAAFDNNTGSWYNEKADWDAWGYVPAQHKGKPILRLRYHYVNWSPNEYKKVKTLELWYHDGAKWIKHITLNCKYPADPWPTYEDFDLFTNPMPNPTGLVRIIGRNSWDRFSYRWVSECQFSVLE